MAGDGARSWAANRGDAYDETNHAEVADELDDADNHLDAPFHIVRERMGEERGGSRDSRNRQPRALGLPWERRLSARGKLWRGALATLTVALLAFMALGGPMAAAQAFTSWRQARFPAAPRPSSPMFSSAPFAYTPPPIGGAHVLTLDVSPSAAHAWTSFACWLQAPTLATRQAGSRQISLAYHANQQNNLWCLLPTPANASATGCTIHTDATNPQALLLDLGAPTQATDPCALTRLYTSSDLGAHWRRVNWPDAAPAACGEHVALLDGRVYVWAASSLLSPSQSHSPRDGRIITARVDGVGPFTWTRADEGLADLAALDVVGERPGGALLALGDETTNGQTRSLLASQNNGASWRREGDLPGAFPLVYVSGDPTDVAHGGWGRLYDLAQSATRGTPDGPAHQSLATAYLGAGWSPVPLPPRPTNLPAASTFNTTEVVGVTTGDALLALRGAMIWNDNAAVPAQPLWLWDTAHARWLLDASLCPENVIALRVAWSQGQATLWVVTAELVIPPTIEVFIATFTRPPAADANQSVAGG